MPILCSLNIAKYLLHGIYLIVKIKVNDVKIKGDRSL